MIFAFSLGVPIGLLVLLQLNHKRKTEQFKTPAWEWIVRRVMTQLKHSKRRDVVHCIIDLSLGTTYGSLVSACEPSNSLCLPSPCIDRVFANSSFGNADKPAFFWWEPVDLLRKLVLVGMLAIVETGSVAQVWAGLMCSFIL
jgi:hypothetical protein